MAAIAQRITPFLWFENQAREAAELYASIFKNSRVLTPGAAMPVVFELEGQRFIALNGGPRNKFTEAVSFVVHCETQEEVDYYWDRLSEGGDPAAQQSGWLKDRFGVSWQVIPTQLGELLGNPDREKAQRAMAAMLRMKKIDLAEMRRAAAG